MAALKTLKLGSYRDLFQTASGFGYGERVIISLPKNLYHAGSNQMLNDGIALKLATRGKGIDNDLTFIPAGRQITYPCGKGCNFQEYMQLSHSLLPDTSL